jgi:hypothetical protein
MQNNINKLPSHEVIFTVQNEKGTYNKNRAQLLKGREIHMHISTNFWGHDLKKKHA